MGGGDKIDQKQKALASITRTNRTELSWPQQWPGKINSVETPAKINSGKEVWPPDESTQPKDLSGG